MRGCPAVPTFWALLATAARMCTATGTVRSVAARLTRLPLVWFREAWMWNGRTWDVLCGHLSFLASGAMGALML